MKQDVCGLCLFPLENGACPYAELDAMNSVDHATGEELPIKADQ